MPFFLGGGVGSSVGSLRKHSTERKECMMRVVLRGGVGLKGGKVLELNSRIVCPPVRC